ncbi:MAG: hypothetical protein QOC92_3792 [Acidimicrobiaceae bacterium]|jgi:hypothetical protein
MILLAVCALTAIFGAAQLFHRATVVDDFTGFSGVSVQDVQDADNGAGAAVVLGGTSLLAAGVVWIIWQFRHAKNAQILRGNYGLSPGWAIGGWFVPLGNYVLPQLQLFQAAKASDPDLPPGQPPSAGSAPTIVPIWWVVMDLAWLLFAIGGSTRPSNSELNFSNIDRFVRADRIAGFSFLLMLIAAVLAIVVVRSLTERQTRALSGHTPTQPQAPAYPPQGYQPPYQQPPPQQWPPPPPPPPQQWPPPPPPPG